MVYVAGSGKFRFITETVLDAVTRYIHGEPVGRISRETGMQEHLIYQAVTRYRRIHGSDFVPYRQAARNR